MIFGIPRLYAMIGGAVGAVLIVVGIWLAITSYGDRRYRAGVDATDRKWEEASQRLKDEAARSATKADDRAAQRLDEFEEQVQEEQEAIDEAIENGSSPFDVLFGS